MTTGELRTRYRLFKIFNIWCQDIELHNLVDTSWRDSIALYGSLWNRLRIIRVNVSRWQRSRYASHSNRIKECEVELTSLLTGPIPSNEVESSSFREKKRELFVELHHLRVVEDRCWPQKSNGLNRGI